MMERSHTMEGEAGRVIRPVDSGVMLSERHFKLEDINELTDALIERSQGRLQELQQAAKIIEDRLRTQVDDGRARIERAVTIAQREIQTRLEETASRSSRVYQERYREGYERGQQEGRERGTATGHEEGFARGYSEGKEQGTAEGREEGLRAIESEVGDKLRGATDDAIASMTSLTDHLRGEWGQSLAAARESLLDLAVRIAEVVIRQKIDDTPELVVSALERALERVEGESVIVVEVHPDDRETLDRFLATRLDQLLDDVAVDLRDSEAVDRGGLVVRGNHTVIEATINGQLDTIRERLLESGGIA